MQILFVILVRDLLQDYPDGPIPKLLLGSTILFPMVHAADASVGFLLGTLMLEALWADHRIDAVAKIPLFA